MNGTCAAVWLTAASVMECFPMMQREQYWGYIEYVALQSL